MDLNSIYYDVNAKKLFDKYESVLSANVLGRVVSHIPLDDRPVIDIGSGSGRDAAYLASKGHKVVAVEPSRTLRSLATQKHGSQNIQWVDGLLPKLNNPIISKSKFKFALISAVWMHLKPDERTEGYRTLFSLLDTNASAFITLRHGPEEQDRCMYPVNAKDEAEKAITTGFNTTVISSEPDLLKRAEVSWEYLEIFKL